MPLRSTLAIFAGVLFLLLPAADAGAATQLEPNATPAMDLSLGVATTDWQGTHFTVPATCNAPGPDQMTCMAHVVLSAQRTAVGKWKPAGPVTTLAQTDVIVAAGATFTVALDAAPAMLRDPLTRARGAAVVTFTFQDAGADIASTGVYVAPPRPAGCGAPAYVHVVSGNLEENDQRGSTSAPLWETLHSPDISGGTAFRVTSGRAAIVFYGVRWTFTKGSQFALSCIALTDYFHRRPFPAIVLDRGKVHAVGKPMGGLRAATVVTSEGNLGMRKAERTDLTVTRDPAKSISTMRVARGNSGQITTLFKGAHRGQHSSPCTNGNALSVTRYGVIRPA